MRWIVQTGKFFPHPLRRSLSQRLCASTFSRRNIADPDEPAPRPFFMVPQRMQKTEVEG